MAKTSLISISAVIRCHAGKQLRVIFQGKREIADTPPEWLALLLRGHRILVLA
jgi:hypothetical protein